MAFVLTRKPGSNVFCGHGPGEVATTGFAKLQVNGASVLLESGVANQPVAGCATAAASGMKPCTSVKSVTQGKSGKLLVGGLPVLLDTLKGTTDGMVANVTPQPLLSGKAAQTKLTSV